MLKGNALSTNLLLIAAFTLSRCGSLGGDGSSLFSKESGRRGDKRTVALPEAEVKSDGDSQIKGFAEQGAEIAGSADEGNQVLLNFDGAQDLTSDHSFIIAEAEPEGGKISIPAFQPSDIGAAENTDKARQDMIQAILAEVQARFKELPIRIVADKAQLHPGAYTVAHIGGLNFTKDDNLLGIAPLDLDNFHKDDLVFIFPQELADRDGVDNLEILKNGISHELAHSFGANHIGYGEKVEVGSRANLFPDIYPGSIDFNVSFQKFDGSGAEHTLDTIRNNLGSSTESAASGNDLGLVQTLNVSRHGNVGQFSPAFDKEQLARLKIGKARFEWIYRDQIVEGRVVRIRFDEEGFHQLKLNIYREGGYDPANAANLHDDNQYNDSPSDRRQFWQKFLEKKREERKQKEEKPITFTFTVGR